MSIKIHAVQTGSVQIKAAQHQRRPGGILRVITEGEWTEPLPIFAWLIEHPEGLIVVDTGDTAQTAQPGYFPRWHPYYRTSVRITLQPDQEIGSQLQRMGIQPGDVKTVVLTHLHTDHAGGIAHFPHSRILVSGPDYLLARSVAGRVQGYMPQHWPAWFDPQPIRFEPQPYGPFDRQCRLTRAGDLTIVPTPGHTPAHVSVVVRSEDVSYFLAGDTSYSEQRLREQTPDGVTFDPGRVTETQRQILALAANEPLVYLPSHDPQSALRLQERRILALA